MASLDDETAKLLQTAVRDERTRMVRGIQKIQWKFLDLSKATLETSPSSSKTYEECATILTDFLLREIDPDARCSVEG
jgi:hypothetical protein